VYFEFLYNFLDEQYKHLFNPKFKFDTYLRSREIIEYVIYDLTNKYRPLLGYPSIDAQTELFYMCKNMNYNDSALVTDTVDRIYRMQMDHLFKKYP